MSDQIKVRIALAEAIVQAMWVKGLITLDEKHLINQKNKESILQAANC